MDTVLESKSPITNLGSSKGWSNLRPAKKGEVRNPSGRPKQMADFIKYLRNWLQESDKDDKTRLQTCLENLQESKPEILLNYAYGKPMETIKLEGAGDMMGTLAIEVAKVLAGQLARPEPKLIEVETVKCVEVATKETSVEVSQ